MEGVQVDTMKRKETKKEKRSVVQLDGSSECGEVFGIQGLDLRRGPLCRVDMRRTPTFGQLQANRAAWGGSGRCLLWREGQLASLLRRHGRHLITQHTLGAYSTVVR